MTQQMHQLNSYTDLAEFFQALKNEGSIVVTRNIMNSYVSGYESTVRDITFTVTIYSPPPPKPPPNDGIILQNYLNSIIDGEDKGWEDGDYND